MKLQTKKIICLLVAIASVMTIVGTVSYAYFTAMADVREQSAVLTSGTMRVRFADNDAGISAELKFGESITKKFTIENTGTLDASLKLYWIDLVNTYTSGSLTYTLTYSETEDGEYTEVVSKTNVPRSENPSKKTLATDIVVPVGTTYYYNLEITLNYLEDVNQDADIKAVFNTKFGIEDLSSKYKVTFDANGGTVGIIEKTIIEGEEYGNLPVPILEGSVFEGWYTEVTGGREVTSDTIVESNENHTLYAHWKKPNPAEIMIAASNGTKTGFDSPATTDEGVYSMEDDYGKSYYYRGAVTNNYVKFGKNASGQDMYWRIIRINGDGSLRILYTGTQAYANGTSNSDMFIGRSVFNTNYNDAKYVGYMYGPAGTTASTSKAQAQTNTESSTIKTYIDNWYKTNIVNTGYSDAVADIIFCNDRSTPGKTATGVSSDTGLGYGTNYTGFGGYARVGDGISKNYYNPQPTFKCPQKNDAFTVSDTTKGNGALTYPVGLITADEVVAAGSGMFGITNKSYYLYRPSNWWWSLSPFTLNPAGYANVFYVNSSGCLSDYSVNYSVYAVAPVINLSAEYVATLRGLGTVSDPYAA